MPQDPYDPSDYGRCNVDPLCSATPFPYTCQDGKSPPISGCVGKLDWFCCPEEKCTRYATYDSYCEPYGKPHAYACPPDKTMSNECNLLMYVPNQVNMWCCP